MKLFRRRLSDHQLSHNRLSFSRLFRQTTSLVMTALCAESLCLLGEILTLPPGSGALTSVPGRIEAVAGGLVLYLAAAVVAAEAQRARETS